jgi:hypothetical protein
MPDGLTEHGAVPRAGIDRLYEFFGHAQGYSQPTPNFKAEKSPFRNRVNRAKAQRPQRNTFEFFASFAPLRDFFRSTGLASHREWGKRRVEARPSAALCWEII